MSNRSSYVLAGALTLVIACEGPPPLYPPNAPDEIKEACAVASRKCTACHDTERIVSARFNPTEWRTTVERMRQFPGSSITRLDVEIILRCLNYHSASSVVRPPSRLLACSD